MAVNSNTNPRFRISSPRAVALCLILFVPLQVFAVLSHPVLLIASAVLLLTGLVVQRVPTGTIIRILLPVLLPAVVTGIARAAETAEVLNLSPAAAISVIVLRFLVLVASAYLLVRSCAIQNALIRGACGAPSYAQSLMLAAWFVLTLIPETARVLRTARTAALFRPGIPPAQRLRTLSSGVLQRVLVSGHERAAAVALRFSAENPGDSPM